MLGKGDLEMNRNVLRCGSLIALILLTACAGPKVVARCPDPQDNGPHHVLQAMELLEADQLEEAYT